MDDAELKEVIKLYSSGLSAAQIRERLSISITVRSIQRALAKEGVIRPRKLAYEIAVREKRLGPKIKRQKIHRLKLPPLLRTIIFERDNFRCQICGQSAKENAVLEIDHINFNIRDNNPKNLQVLCWVCNLGKRQSRA